MDSKTEEEYLEFIEDLVHNERATVTFNSLMRKFELKADRARELLTKFISNNTSNESLLATYLISGQLENDGFAYRLSLQKDLDSKKAEFKDVNNVLLYSVQGGKEFNDLSLVDRFENNNCSYNSAVVSRKCQIKQFEVSLTAVAANKPVDKVSAGPSKIIKEEPKSSNFTTSTNSKPLAKKNSGNIANMFAKMPAKPEIKKEPDSPDKENKHKLNNIKEVQSVTKSTADRESFKEEVSTKAKTHSKSQSKKKRSRKDNDSEQVAKKRKRIIERNDSDSDDMFARESDGSEDIIEESDHEEKPVARVVTPPPPCPKNKKRKQVDQTTMEDGFLVTTKVWVYESASENEDEMPPKKIVKEEPKPTKLIKKADSQEDVTGTSKGGKKGKKTPPANQPTLMNFFKKK